MPVGSGSESPRPPASKRMRRREAGEALRVAQPAGLVDGLVDGDHEPVAEFEHVRRLRRRRRRRPHTW